MNDRDEQRIADLAMKTVEGQLTPMEQAEQAALFVRVSSARREFVRRRAEALTLSKATSLLNATESQSGELPSYARERLRTRVREIYGTPKSSHSGKPTRLNWRLLLGSALGTAVMVVILSLLLRPNEPVLHLAMLDPVGEVRGSDSDVLGTLQSGWPEAKASAFKSADELADWKKSLTAANAKDIVVVIYDRSAGELLVSGKKHGRLFAKRFEVGVNLAPVLEQARRFIGAQ